VGGTGEGWGEGGRSGGGGKGMGGTILHRPQSTAGRAVPGKDLAGKKLHVKDVLPDDDDNEDDVVVHKKAGAKRKQ
jgi:hypothetical protein